MTREQVVEVVRDAAGEPADRLHLLRLPQLLLQPPALLLLGAPPRSSRTTNHDRTPRKDARTPHRKIRLATAVSRFLNAVTGARISSSADATATDQNVPRSRIGS